MFFMSGNKKQALRIFLVRHGETADNVQMRYIGMRDEPLTDKGMRQADQVAEALASFPIRAIYTSPLMRAAATAARIQEACGAPIQADSRLVEGSFGRWEGLTRDEVIERGSPDVELLARWETDASSAPPGGESLGEVQGRIVNLVEELEREMSGEFDCARQSCRTDKGAAGFRAGYSAGGDAPVVSRPLFNQCRRLEEVSPSAAVQFPRPPWLGIRPAGRKYGDQ